MPTNTELADQIFAAINAHDVDALRELWAEGVEERFPDKTCRGKEELAAHSTKQKIQVDYEIGDSVKVLDGPFASFNGIVEELDFDRGRVKVSVSIFGRATPVELEFEQVERVK